MIDKVLADLLSGPQFERSYDQKRELLLPLLTERARQAVENHLQLASGFDQLGYSTDEAGDYDELPYLPVSLFKEFDLATVPSDQIVRTLLSSSTTGSAPSRIPLNKSTSKNQSRGLAAILKDVLGGKRRPFLVLDVPEINQPGEELTARGAAVRGIMPFASELTYGLKLEAGGFSLDTAAMDEFFTQNANREVLVFGFTYLVWTEVVKALEKAGKIFNHPEMTLLHSGGWKRLTEQQVDKTSFAAAVGRAFGCAPEQVRDFYGMVEQVGVVFVDCEAGHKHSPAFAEVAIRDFDTLKQVDVGGSGLIQVMSLLPDSYPGFALITEDVGQLLGYDDCPCGRGGLYFRFRSRVHQVEVRGCGDTVAVSGISGDQVREKEKGHHVPVSESIVQLGGVDIPVSGEMKIRFSTLHRRLEKDPLPAEAVLGLLDDAAKRLLDPELAGIEGLAFLSAWLKRANLERVLDTNFGSRREALTAAVPDAGSALLAVPRGVVGHWVAGNVPTLAVFSWALATLAGNSSILRVSQASIGAARGLFAAMEKSRYVLDGKEYTGSDLLEKTSVLHFDSDLGEVNKAMSRVCDARCIWGGRQAVEAVRALPAAEHCEDLVFGPKFSMAVIDRAALAQPEAAAELARTLAREVAVFEQAACSSPQILFLEGSLSEHENWLASLNEQMARVQGRNPRLGVSETAAAAIVRARASYAMKDDHRVWASTGTEHSLLAAHGATLGEAVQGRTLFVQSVENLDDVLPLLSPKIQTLGVAVSDPELSRRFCAKAAARGVSRCVPIGTMNFFETPWDGMLPVNRLVRWVRVPAGSERP